jgi:hypothetical protein
MSDIDEQLKRVRLQKEQLELEQLLAQQRRTKLMEGLPSAIFQLLKIPLLAIAGLAHKTRNLISEHKKWFRRGLVTVILLCIAIAIYEINQSENERQRELRIQARRAAVVQEKCGELIKSADICIDSLSDRSRSDVERIACFNTYNEKKYCIAMAGLIPVSAD